MAGESRSVVVRLSLDTAQAIRASKEFGSEFGRAMDQAERSTGKTRAAMDQLTSTSGKLALAAGAGLAAVIVTTANFDEAMSHVAATGDDARSSFDQLREAAIQAGQDTAFSATEAAGGIENLAKAGVSAQDILGGGLKGSLDLAAAGGLQVADAAEIAATALTQFKLQGSDVPHVADLLAAAAGKAQGDVSDLGMALKQSGLVASQMGLSLEETTGTLAAFASAGLLGSDAGTSFRTMLLRLANPTTESANLMDSLGISAYDAQGKFVGMASVAEQLKAALQDKTQAERDSALATIFGSDAIRAASILYDQGASGIDKWTSAVNDQGYAAETAATRMDNLKGDVEQLKGSLETAFIGSGSGSTGMLRSLVQGATDLVNVFNKAPGPVQQTATALLGLATIGAGGFWLTSKAITTINDTRSALSDLGVSAGKTGTALKLIGGATAAAAVLIAVEQAADAAVKSTDKAAPGIESLTRSLLSLQSATGLQGVAQDVGDLSGAIETLSDPSLSKQVGDLYSKVPLIGQVFVDTAPGLAAAQQEARNATTTITALDEALAGIVSSGSPEQAQATFAQLADAYHLSGTEQKKLLDLLPQYKEALDGASNAADLTAGATERMSVGQRQAAAQAKQLASAMEAEQEAAQSTAESFLNFGDNLDNAKVSLADWIKSIENQADALRNFGENASDAARKGLDEGLIKSLEKAGPAGALRLKQLANASEAEIARANKAWRSGQREIDRFKDTLGGLKPANLDLTDAQFRAKLNAAETSLRRYGLTRAQADLLVSDLASGKIKTVQQLVNKYGLTKAEATALLKDLASGKLKAVQGLLADLDGKHATSYVDVYHRSFYSKLGNDADPATPRAGGGPIVGRGTKTSDDVPVMASNGEFMMSAAAVDHYGIDTMFAINARRLASGGPVSGSYGRYASAGAGGTPYMPDVTSGAHSAASALYGLAGASVKELHAREHLLKQEVASAQKIADAEKARLDELKQAQSSLIDTLKEKFNSQLFGNQSEGFQGQSSMVPVRQADGTIEWQEVAYSDLSAEEQAAQYQSWQSSQPSATDILQGDNASLERALSLIPILKKMGIHGQALRELIESGDLAEIEAYAFGTKRDARQYQRLYDRRQRLEGQFGRAGGDAVYGKQIREQTKEFQEANGHLKDVKTRLDAVEKAINKATDPHKGVHVDAASQKGIGQAVGAHSKGSATPLRKGTPK